MAMSADYQSMIRSRFSMARYYFVIEPRRDNNNATPRIPVDALRDKLPVRCIACFRNS